MKNFKEHTIAFGKYSLWFGFIGIVSYFLFFPDGIYSAFFFGAIGLTCGIVARKERIGGIASIFGILLCLICIVFSSAAYYGLLLLFRSLSDPEVGPKLTAYFIDMLKANGLSLEAFRQF